MYLWWVLSSFQAEVNGCPHNPSSPGAPALSAWCVRAQAMLYSRDALAGPRVRSVQAQARALCPWRMCQCPPRALWWESSLRSAGALVTKAVPRSSVQWLLWGLPSPSLQGWHHHPLDGAVTVSQPRPFLELPSGEVTYISQG